MDKILYPKVDPIGKLHIIYSLDNGQSKIDIARQYGVHPRTITYIYRQKELIIKKYTLKYYQFKEICDMNLDHSLLDWLKLQIINGSRVTEENLLNKAQEMVHHTSEKFIFIEEWLLNFRQRYNIIKYSPEVQHDTKSLEKWKKIVACVDTEEIYVCGTCALAHSFSVDSLATTGEQPTAYMSIFFIVHTLGYNRRKLAVVGKDKLIAESNISSIPVNYYCNNGQVSRNTIFNHLNEWDVELASEGKTVCLVVNMPDNNCIADFKFNNIRILQTNMEFISKSLEKVIECFKYQYRKLQITRNVGQENNLFAGQLDYINMISLAWYNVADCHVKFNFFPPCEGNLYIRDNYTCDGNHSLLDWCHLYKVPLNLQLYGHCLDQFIFCDKDLKYIDSENNGDDANECQTNHQSASGMEAYQAVRRLLSYIQGENAPNKALKSAKYLENHLEYGALLEVHNIIDNCDQ